MLQRETALRLSERRGSSESDAVAGFCCIQNATREKISVISRREQTPRPTGEDHDEALENYLNGRAKIFAPECGKIGP
jgi:hypothetical protein